MILIKNGSVHNGRGQIFKSTDILIADGIISAIGQELDAPAGVEVYDAKGKTVFPGFIESLNVWGCFGPGFGDKDLNEHSDPVTPEMDVVYSFDHDSMVYQSVFEYGITAAGITPSTANVVGGQAAVFKTHGKHPYEMLVKEKAAMVASVSSAAKKLYGPRNVAPMTRMGAIALLQQALVKASEYKGSQEGTEYDARSEALRRLLDRELPLFVNCNTKSEMNAVERVLKDYSIELVFTGAFGADESVGRSLIVGDLTFAMSEHNQKVDFAAMAKLVASGIKVAISSCGDHAASGKESLLWNAMMWYKQGFSSTDVLKMITSVPANLLGVDHRIGSIEVGKDADIVVWSANPIETYSATVEAAFVTGKNVLCTGREASCW